MAQKSGDNPALHAGHRQRLKNRFLNEGLDNFEMHNLLELLLFFTTARQDTNETAHRLVRLFGSFSAVCDADFDVLCAVDGVGREGAMLIKMLPELCRCYMSSKYEDVASIDSAEDAAEYFKALFLGYTVEMFMVCYLDSNMNILRLTKQAKGRDDSVQVDINKIIAEALLLRAKGIIIAHNHPHGFAAPSQEDMDMTECLFILLRDLGLRLCEHVIVSGSETFCMSQMNSDRARMFVFATE